MIKVYSEHRLNEDWFLRSKGFAQREWDVGTPTNGKRGRRYSADRNDRGVSVREFNPNSTKKKWVASCTGNSFQTPGYPDVESAYMAGELANWGER